MNLENKVALITGASSGIGKAISLKLGEEGTRVALLAPEWTRDKLEKVKKEINKNKGDAYFVLADLRKGKEVKKAVEDVFNHYKTIDILINNAGLGIFKEAEKLKIKEWDDQINVMLRGAYLTTKYVLPHMYKRGNGHIIIISSMWAKQGCRLSTAYTAAKYGLRGYADSLREEARRYNVKVTNIMPATVATPFFDKTGWKHDFSKALKPEDIANFVVDVLRYPGNMVIEEATVRSIEIDEGTLLKKPK